MTWLNEILTISYYATICPLMRALSADLCGTVIICENGGICQPINGDLNVVTCNCDNTGYTGAICDIRKYMIWFFGIFKWQHPTMLSPRNTLALTLFSPPYCFSLSQQYNCRGQADAWIKGENSLSKCTVNRNWES